MIEIRKGKGNIIVENHLFGVKIILYEETYPKIVFRNNILYEITPMLALIVIIILYTFIGVLSFLISIPVLTIIYIVVKRKLPSKINVSARELLTEIKKCDRRRKIVIDKLSIDCKIRVIKDSIQLSINPLIPFVLAILFLASIYLHLYVLLAPLMIVILLTLYLMRRKTRKNDYNMLSKIRLKNT